MKILFISDIHGSYENLDYIDTIIKDKGIDKLIVLGDLYYSGFGSDINSKINGNIVKDFLTKYSDILICMRGNCDSDVDIKVSDFPICNDLSMLLVDDLHIYITHGNKYNNKKTNNFYNTGILVYGHEHIPYIDKQGDMTYICVGSISFPRNEFGHSYMIYEDKNFILYNINNEIIDSISF